MGALDTLDPGSDDFDMVAASLRASGGDVRVFIEVLARKLEAVLPGMVRVDRRSPRLLAEKQVRKIECAVGEHRYLLSVEHGTLDARRASAVRGVVLKTEQMALDAWIDALALELTRHARSNEQARAALENLLRG